MWSLPCAALSRRNGNPFRGRENPPEIPVPPEADSGTCNQRQLWYSNFQDVDATFSEKKKLVRIEQEVGNEYSECDATNDTRSG